MSNANKNKKKRQNKAEYKCPKCKHWRFRTKKKVDGEIAIVACRGCGLEMSPGQPQQDEQDGQEGQSEEKNE